jgi:hypothetical protein
MLHVEVHWQQHAGTQSHLVVEAEIISFFKMAALLQSCTKQEMRSVIRFLDAEGAKQVEIYTRMLAKYGAPCVSKTKVYPEWIQKFKNVVQSFEESPRSGQAHRVATPE